MSTFASNTLALGPEFISADNIAKAGIVVVMLIVFAESGLLIGFFLPGDSLLFTLGLFIAGDDVSTPLWLACLLIGFAAVLGDQVGYLFGRKVGPSLFRRPNSRLFKQENVEKAHEFFDRYGPRSIVLARFVPIVRTFTPVIAGVSRMNYRVFVTYNIIGGVLWGCGVTVLGFYLGKIEFVRNNIEAMALLIVFISVLPIAFELLRGRSKAKKEAAAGGEAGPGAAGTDRPGTGPDAAQFSASGAVGFPGAVAGQDADGGGRSGSGGRSGGGKHSVAAAQRRGGTPPNR